MNLRQVTGLIARRALALLLDLAILLIFLLTICVGASIASVNCFGPGWNPVLFTVLLCYFGVTETLGSGQTPGKRVAGIRLETTGSGRLSSCQTFARISLVLLSPVAAVLAYQLLCVCHIIPGSIHLAHPFLLLMSCIIWPISVIVGRGQVGLHDYLLHTQVRHVTSDGTTYHSTIGHLYPWAIVVVSGVISLVFVHVVFGRTSKAVVDYSDKMSGGERRECIRLARDARELPLRIENGPEFTPGAGIAFFIVWTNDLWREWRVTRSCVALPDDIRQSLLSLRGSIQYVIPISARGLSSSIFQHIAMRDICQRAVQQGYLVTVEFVYTWQMGPFAATIKKRYLAFAREDVGKDGKVSNVICCLEPDTPVVFRIGLCFGDSTSRPALF
jgi:uncharacterized RDD family membrane protein YckC